MASKFVWFSHGHLFKAAVNAPQSRRSGKSGVIWQTRSARAPVALAPLWRIACLLAFLAWIPVGSAQTSSVTEAETAYTRTITQRADKIVAALNIADTNKFVRVRDGITQQYRDLRTIHDVRDAQLKAAKEKFSADKTAADAAMAAIRVEAQQKLDQLHPVFLKRLSGELTSEQVDQVKDGMTYGVLPLTYGVYLRMYPDLSEEQKLQIRLFLTEAREIAMDGSTSDEKHAVFGKYKGKINNYLSKAGYDAKKGEQNLRKPAAPPPPKLN